MSDAAAWNLVVSRSTDDAVREFLANEAPDQRTDLSSFVEDAVKTRLFELAVEQARRQVAHLCPDEIDRLADEAVEWARRN